MNYVGILSNKGIVVQEKDAFDYAIQQINSSEELKTEFVEWFFSGNFVKEE